MSIERFLLAQESVYDTALAEIRSGRKRGHWIWFVFPQIKGLGISETSRRYAIKDIDEAREYLDNPILKSRLVEISKALVELAEFDPVTVMGYPDNLKLHSSMTLFHRADADEPVFKMVLDKYFDGKPDKKTMDILFSQESGKEIL